MAMNQDKRFDLPQRLAQMLQDGEQGLLPAWIEFTEAVQKAVDAGYIMEEEASRMVAVSCDGNYDGDVELEIARQELHEEAYRQKVDNRRR